MCHKEGKMGTMVERIQPVSPANFLHNMVKTVGFPAGTETTEAELGTALGSPKVLP